MKKLFTILASAALIGTSVAAVHQSLKGDVTVPEAPAAKVVAKAPLLAENSVVKTLVFDVTGIPQDATRTVWYKSYDEATDSYTNTEYNSYYDNRVKDSTFGKAYLDVRYGMWSEDGIIVDGNRQNDDIINRLYVDTDVADIYSALNVTFYCEDMVGIDAENPLSYDYSELCPIYYGDNSFTISIANPTDVYMDNIGIYIHEGQSMKVKHIDYQVNLLRVDHIVDLGNNNYVGCCLRDYDYSFAPNGMYAMIYRFATDDEEFHFPAKVEIEGEEYDVLGIGASWFGDYGDMWIDEMYSDFAPNCKTVYVPESVKGVRFDYCNFADVYLPGETKVSANCHGTIHVDNTQACRDYLSAGYKVVKEYPDNWITINVTKPGSWAQEYITLAGETWSAFECIKVTGNINDVDLAQMAHLEYLDKLDLSETDITSIPSDFLSGSTNSVSTVILPNTVTTINERAFRSCRNLRSINLENVEIISYEAFKGNESLEYVDLSSTKSIDREAFYDCYNLKSIKFPVSCEYYSLYERAFENCTSLESVELPEGLTGISYRSFSNCRNLKSISMPSTLRHISESALSCCVSLSDITVPEGVTSIDSWAFDYCSNLKEIYLPTTLTHVGDYILDECPNLQTVKCAAVMPPSASRYMVTDLNTFKATLYVLPFSKDLYRNSEGWLNFLLVDDLMQHVDKLYVERPLELQIDAEYNDLLSNNPVVEIDGYGELTLHGNGTFSAGNFLINSTQTNRENFYNWNINTSTMINSAENMRADAVTTNLRLVHRYGRDYRWCFISFPYDVKISDIIPGENVYWTIRGYDASARAQAEFDKTWKNFNEDYVLQAGKGYIMAAVNASRGYWDDYEMEFIVPGLNNTNKNKIFATGDVTVELEEQASEFPQNRSWNLIGNPYPAYYQLNTLKNFTAPVTIWRGGNYAAYSPLDDDVILCPNEAFFVQCPTESNLLTFAAEGRLHRSEAYRLDENSYTGMHAPANISVDGRNVFNFDVAGENITDRTRVVLNPAAKAAYEMSCDAPKFFAETGTALELYTTADGIDYSINERPIADGIVAMGIKAKTGVYTITLSGKYSHDYTVLLTDNVTGQVTDLTSDSYTFTVDEGNQSSRFTITFETGLSGIDSINSQVDADTEVTLTSVNGMVLYQGAMSGIRTNAPGIYIINANGASYKTFLK